VDDIELASGQEVTLKIGAVVRIGPYKMRAILPGDTTNYDDNASLIKEANAPRHELLEQNLVKNTVSAPPAVIHTSEHEFLPEVVIKSDAIKQVDGDIFSEASGGVEQNPFAILGRRNEESIASTNEKNIGSLNSTKALDSEPLGSENSLLSQGALDEKNLFGLANIERPHAQPKGNRPLIIPDDFDPFAPDKNREAENSDHWAGGLPAQELADVANISADELIKSLPLKGAIDKELDNPAHSGLPESLDPKTQLDPLSLFGGAGANDILSSDAGWHDRGSQLVQVFNLPKGVNVDNQLLSVDPVEDDLLGMNQERVSGAIDVSRKKQEEVDFGNSNTESAHSVDAIRVNPLHAASNIAVERQDIKSDVKQNKILDHVKESHVFAHRHLIDQTNSAELATLSLPVQSDSVDKTLPKRDVAQIETNSLIDAFLAGAGLEPRRVSEVSMTTDFMHQFGEAFRTAVQGTMDLLAARSEIKREFRSDVTIISPKENNPLKFLPNADGVIMQMVGQNFPGFMKPIPAMKEAYFDLQIHQLALMAGIRAAYAEALARLDPAELEKKFETGGSLITKISSTAQKAALWDDYKQRYTDISRHAEDDLAAFSGEAFVKAYDAAVDSTKN